MNKKFSYLITAAVSTAILSSCSNNMVQTPILNVPVQNTINTFNTIEKPVFNKRKLGRTGVRLNSLSIQKEKQTKLHTYYFKIYSKGSSFYEHSDNNPHITMLKKAESSIGLNVNANSDEKITLNEILSFVTSTQYIQDFRKSFVEYSFKKLDDNSNKKLSMDEFSSFNKKVKSKELPDFQLLEEFAEHDYNSSRDLDIEEYEDFFMLYLLAKVGANR